MDQGKFSEEELMDREERCKKALKTVGKAIFMRLFVTAVLIWVVFQTNMEVWVVGLIVFVMIINLSGLLPLSLEMKKKYGEFKQILDLYE